MVVIHYITRKLLVLAACTASFWLWIVHQSNVQHRHNQCSCPGYSTPQVTHNDTDVGYIQEFTPEGNATTLPDFGPSTYAYVFYATKAEYACSVLINIDRLKNLFHTKERIIILVKPTLNSDYLSRFAAQNATVIPYEPPPLFDNGKPYYSDVLLKLIGFRLHQYIPSLQRILILDSDQLILQPLDHIFSLPAVDLAAPRAYWKGSFGFTSAFLLVSLSERLWTRMEDALRTIQHDTFDMDLLNEIFAETALLLPGDYCTLNSVWETNDIPKWWQGSEPPRDPTWKPSRKLPPTPDPPPIDIPPSLKGPLATNDTSNLSENDQVLLAGYHNDNAKRESTIQAAKDAVEKAHEDEVWKDELKERGIRLRKTLEDVYKEVKVMHYTALAKPWRKYVGEVKRARPDAHGLFAKGFEEWRVKAKEVCPGEKGEYVV